MSDVMMPELGGHQFAERLAAEHPALPVVWMSGYPRDSAFGDGQQALTQPFLLKPIRAELLVRTVGEVLAQRKQTTGR